MSSDLRIVQSLICNIRFAELLIIIFLTNINISINVKRSSSTERFSTNVRACKHNQ